MFRSFITKGNISQFVILFSLFDGSFLSKRKERLKLDGDEFMKAKNFEKWDIFRKVRKFFSGRKCFYFLMETSCCSYHNFHTEVMAHNSLGQD